MLTDPLELNPVTEPRYFKTAKVAHLARQELCVVLRDTQGNALDLGSKEIVQMNPCGDCATCPPDADNPGFDDGVEPKKDWPDVSIKMVASPGFGCANLFEAKEGKIIDYDNGKVVFHLDQTELSEVGVFLAEIGLYRDVYLLQRWPMYLSIEPSLFAGSTSQKPGYLTIPEIRLFLRDLEVGAEDLLDSLEFHDSEIIASMRAVVDEWNEMLPPEPMLFYSYENFEFRHSWLRATCGFLLEMAAHKYRRNDLEVSAGGIRYLEDNKAPGYEKKSAQLLEEWRVWARQKKVAMNLAIMNTSFRSTFPG